MNVVDSCGWLEYFANGSNANFFAPAIECIKELIVPDIVVFEVSRRLRQLYGEDGEARGLSFLEKGQFVSAGPALMRQAATAASLYKLAMDDAIIWQTAQAHQAALYTQDVDLQGLPGVIYQARTTFGLSTKASA